MEKTGIITGKQRRNYLRVHHTAEQEQKRLRPATRSTRRPHPGGRSPCPAPQSKVLQLEDGTGSFDLAPGFSSWAGGLPGPPGRCGRGLQGRDQSVPSCRSPADVPHRCHLQQHAGSVLPDRILKVSPASADQGRFQSPLKRLYFPCVFEDFLTFSGTRSH